MQKKPGNCIPQQQSRYLPSTLPPLCYEEDSEGAGRDTGSSSQLLEPCRAPGSCRAGQGLPARPAAAPLPAAHPLQKGTHAARAGQRPSTWTKLGCPTHLACMLGHTKDTHTAWLLWLSANSLSSLRADILSVLRVLWDMLHVCVCVCVWPHLCHKHKSRAQTSSPSVLPFPSFSHIPRLQHLLTKVSL